MHEHNVVCMIPPFRIQATMGVVHTLQPRQVDLEEIAVRWKLEQTLDQEGGGAAGKRHDSHLRHNEKCVATIQLRRDGTVMTRFEGKDVVRKETSSVLLLFNP